MSAGACPPVGEGRRIRDPEATASGSCPFGPPDSRSDIEDIGRTIETIENRFPKRGEVVEADEGGALCPETDKVGRLEAARDVPMDQESRWIRNRDRSRTGPCDRNIRLRRHRREDATGRGHPGLERNPSCPSGEIRGGAPAASGVTVPPGGMARLCTKGILYRGHVARLPALFFWRSGRFLRGNALLTAFGPVVTGPLPSDNLTMGVGLLC